MSLVIYNTLTRRKEEFAPLKEKQVRIYVCGLTVYDYCHIGHSRAFIVFDVIYRYFLHRGYNVTFIRNFTDVEDKIIKRAAEKGISAKDLAEFHIAEYQKDAELMRLKSPTVEPKATEHMAEIIALIEALIEKGYAYVVDGDVLYSIERFAEYGKLSGKKIEDLQAGARVEISESKRNPLDFVLWKGSKPGEPSWKSPWGEGRPGWHIECSAMASKYLGENFDIHGGGLDLIFPHHENEVAQSEAATGKPFARIWMHNGLINLGREKMSKSIGNIITIREFLKKYPVEALRFYILSAHYRNPMDFDEERVEEAIATLERFYKTMVRMQDLSASSSHFPLSHSPLPLWERVKVGGQHKGGSPEGTLLEDAALSQVIKLKDRFEEAMEDDFNTAKAIGYLFQVVRALNQYCDSLTTSGGTISKDLIDQFYATLKLYQEVFGLFEEKPKVWLRTLWEERARSVDLSPDVIEAKIAERLQARKRSDWELADAIRQELMKHGVILEDSPDGTTWRVKR